MNIRTKLALALVSVSLLSMWLLGGFAYQVSSNLLREISERQLDALAESKMQDLEQIIDGWRDHVRLIRSRTELRIQLQEFQELKKPDALVIMQRIADDAQESTAHIARITLFDRHGNAVIAAGEAERSAIPAQATQGDEVRYAGFYLGTDKTPKLLLTSLMQIEQEVIGSIEVVIDASSLGAFAASYRGLGESGETMVIGHDQTGALVLLHALRHSEDSLPWASPPEYVQAAVSGSARIFRRNVKDYRGNDVWAATRFVPDVNWGLVVKVDAEEEGRRARSLREKLIDLGLALAAFAIVGGTLLGFYLARPIRDLAQIVERVRQGETTLRADASSDDEIGLLAKTLNVYLDQVARHQERRSADDRST